MYTAIKKRTYLRRLTALLTASFFLLNVFTSDVLALAPELRTKPFSDATKSESELVAKMMSAACEIRKLIEADNARENPMIRLNLNERYFPNGEVRIDNVIHPENFKCSGRAYDYALFHFKKEKKTIKAIFIRDYEKLEDKDKLTADELAELGVNTAEDKRHFLDSPEHPALKGVWFVNSEKTKSAIERFKADRATFFKNLYGHVTSDPSILKLPYKEKVRRVKALPGRFDLTENDTVFPTSILENARAGSRIAPRLAPALQSLGAARRGFNPEADLCAGILECIGDRGSATRVDVVSWLGRQYSKEAIGAALAKLAEEGRIIFGSDGVYSRPPATAPPAAKGFNVELSQETLSYDELDFAAEFDGAYLDFGNRRPGDLDWDLSDGGFGIFVKLDNAAQRGAAALRDVVGEALDLLAGTAVEAVNERGLQIYDSVIKGLKKHNGLRIRVARNLPQNSCLYRGPRGNNVLVFGENFIKNTMILYPLTDPAFVEWTAGALAGAKESQELVRREMPEAEASSLTSMLFNDGELLALSEYSKHKLGSLKWKSDLLVSIASPLHQMQRAFSRKAVLWPLSERLNHELGHSNEFRESAAELNEECECAYRDYLLLKYVLCDGDTEISRSEVDKFTKLASQAYRSASYYKFLYSLVELNSDRRAKNRIKGYVRSHYTRFVSGAKPFPNTGLSASAQSVPAASPGKNEPVPISLHEAPSTYNKAIAEARAEYKRTRGTVDLVALGARHGLTQDELTRLAKEVRPGQGMGTEIATALTALMKNDIQKLHGLLTTAGEMFAAGKNREGTEKLNEAKALNRQVGDVCNDVIFLVRGLPDMNQRVSDWRFAGRHIVNRPISSIDLHISACNTSNYAKEVQAAIGQADALSRECLAFLYLIEKGALDRIGDYRSDHNSLYNSLRARGIEIPAKLVPAAGSSEQRGESGDVSKRDAPAGSAIEPQKMSMAAFIGIVAAPFLVLATLDSPSVVKFIWTILYCGSMLVLPVLLARNIEDALSFRRPGKAGRKREGSQPERPNPNDGIIRPFWPAENIRLIEDRVEGKDAKGKVSYFSYTFDKKIRSGQAEEMKTAFFVDRDALRRMGRFYQWIDFFHEWIHGNWLAGGRFRVKVELVAVPLTFCLPWIAINLVAMSSLGLVLSASDLYYLAYLTAYNTLIPVLMHIFAAAFGIKVSPAGHRLLGAKARKHLSDEEIDELIEDHVRRTTRNPGSGDMAGSRKWLGGGKDEDNVELIECQDRPEDILVIKARYKPSRSGSVKLIRDKLAVSRKRSFVLIIVDPGQCGARYDNRRRNRISAAAKDAVEALRSLRTTKSYINIPERRFVRKDIRSAMHDLTRLRDLLKFYRRRLDRIRTGDLEREAVSSEVHGHVDKLKTALGWLRENGYRDVNFIGDYIGHAEDEAGFEALDLLKEHMESKRMPRIRALLGMTEHIFLRAMLGDDNMTDNWLSRMVYGGPCVLKSLQSLAGKDIDKDTPPRLQNEIQEARDFEAILKQLAGRDGTSLEEQWEKWWRFHPKVMDMAKFMTENMRYVYYEDKHHNIYLVRAIAEKLSWRGLSGLEALRVMEDEFREKTQFGLWVLRLMREIWLLMESGNIDKEGYKDECLAKIAALIRREKDADKVAAKSDLSTEALRNRVLSDINDIVENPPDEPLDRVFELLAERLSKDTRPLPQIFDRVFPSDKEAFATSPFATPEPGGIATVTGTDEERQAKRINLGVNTVITQSSFSEGLQELGYIRIVDRNGNIVFVSVDGLMEGKVKPKLFMSGRVTDEAKSMEHKSLEGITLRKLYGDKKAGLKGVEEIVSDYDKSRERVKERWYSHYVNWAWYFLSTPLIPAEKPVQNVHTPPAGSIYSVFTCIAEAGITGEDGALTVDEIATKLKDGGRANRILSHNTLTYDVRALYYHLHLIEKAPGSRAGKDARYYVPEAVKKKAAELLPVLQDLTGKDLRPRSAFLDALYETRIRPILEKDHDFIAGAQGGELRAEGGAAAAASPSQPAAAPGGVSLSDTFPQALKNLESIADLNAPQVDMLVEECLEASRTLSSPERAWLEAVLIKALKATTGSEDKELEYFPAILHLIEALENSAESFASLEFLTGIAINSKYTMIRRRAADAVISIARRASFPVGKERVDDIVMNIIKRSDEPYIYKKALSYLVNSRDKSVLKKLRGLSAAYAGTDKGAWLGEALSFIAGEPDYQAAKIRPDAFTGFCEDIGRAAEPGKLIAVDLGSGLGAFERNAMRKGWGKTFNIVSTDAEEENVRNALYFNWVEARKMSWGRLEFADKTVHLATLNFPNPSVGLGSVREALQEAYRVLQYGGGIAFYSTPDIDNGFKPEKIISLLEEIGFDKRGIKVFRNDEIPPSYPDSEASVQVADKYLILASKKASVAESDSHYSGHGDEIERASAPESGAILKGPARRPVLRSQSVEIGDVSERDTQPNGASPSVSAEAPGSPALIAKADDASLLSNMKPATESSADKLEAAAHEALVKSSTSLAGLQEETQAAVQASAERVAGRFGAKILSEAEHAARKEADRIHAENTKLENMPAIADKEILCHIITDSILPSDQLNMLKVSIDQAMDRENKHIERIAALSGDNAGSPDTYIEDLRALIKKKQDLYASLGYTKVRFTLACPDVRLVDTVLGSGLDVKALAFEPCDTSRFNLVQVEGIMLALRALDSGDLAKLKSVFAFLAKHPLAAAEAGIADINTFIRKVAFILPAAKIEDHELRRTYHYLARQIWQAA